MKNITFKQFIYTYNFRYIHDTGEEDTTIIQLYWFFENGEITPDNWIMFGINDWCSKNDTWDICKKMLSERVLSSFIEMIEYDKNIIKVYLTPDGKRS